MKKFLILFIGIILMPNLNAQDITDAVRYSVDEIKGTARFRAMSGAFGALGGDLSAVSLNPAGSAIFNKSYASVSITNFDRDNSADFLGNGNVSSNSNVEFSQAGAAFVFNNTSGSSWRKIVLGLVYELTGNYDDDFFVTGMNTNSIDSYFLSHAQGKRLDEISRFVGESYTEAYGDIGAAFGYSHQQAFLGFESYILEPEDIDNDANTVYFSNIGPGLFNQEYAFASTGYNGKFGVNAAIQHEDNLYLGINLNSHFINYSRSTLLVEGNSNANSFINEVYFENNLSTTGTGFSFQLGAISKLNDNLRVGFTYDSPVWFDINEETTQYLETFSSGGIVVDGQLVNTLVINPQLVNVFPEYKLQTPSKITGSVALILGNSGLISFDYSRKDYSKTKFKPESDPSFVVQNSIMNSNLGVSNTYRLGGELRHNEFSFRGGYRFEESPYNNTGIYGDLKGYSLGIGYNFGNTRLDVAYENSNRAVNYQLYDTGLTNAVRIDTDNTDLTISLNFSL